MTTDDLLKALGTGAGSGLISTAPKNSTTTGTSSTSQSSNSNEVTSNQALVDALTQAFSNSKAAQTSTTSPSLTPGLRGLMDSLTQKFGSITQIDPSKIEAQGLQSINKNAGFQQNAVNETLAARGLGTSPVAASAENGVSGARFSAINDFQSKLPQLLQSLQLGSFNPAAAFLSSAPTGQTTTGTSENSGTQGSSSTQTSQSNSIINSIVQALSSGNSTSANTQGTSTAGSIAGGIGNFLMALFGGKP